MIKILLIILGLLIFSSVEAKPDYFGLTFPDAINESEFNAIAAKTVKKPLPEGVRKVGQSIEIDSRSGVVLKQKSKSRATLTGAQGLKKWVGDVDVYCNCGSGNLEGCNLVKQKKYGDVISGGVWKCQATDDRCGNCKMIILGDSDEEVKVQGELGMNDQILCEDKAGEFSIAAVK